MSIHLGGFVAVYFDAAGNRIYGSNGTMIAADLKTDRGAVKRALQWLRNVKRAVSVKVYRVPPGRFYRDDSEWRLVAHRFAEVSP